MLEYSRNSEYAIQFDLKKFYHQIDINPANKTYFGFTFPLFATGSSQYFVWKTLPYGYTRAPFIARSLIKPLVNKWRALGGMVVVFYDDGMAVDRDAEFLKKLSLQMHCDLLRAGLVPGIEKCNWNPIKNVVWNGLEFDFVKKILKIKNKRIDSALLSLTDDKSNWPNITFRDIARIVGKIQSMQPVFGPLVQLRTRLLQNFVNIKHYRNVSWDCYIQADYVPLFERAFAELDFWIRNLHCLNDKSFLDDLPSWIIWTDASDYAVGGFVAQLAPGVKDPGIWTADNWLLGHDKAMPIVRSCARLQTDAWPWSYRKDPPVVRDVHDLNPELLHKALICHRNLSLAEKAVDSNERELIAARFVLENCAPLMSGSAVTLYTDNSNVAIILQKGSSKLRLQSYAESVQSLLQNYSIALKSSWIPRDLNNVADLISCTLDYDDFSVTVEFFRIIQQQLRVTFTVDAFANAKNAKVDRYFSITFSKGCIGVDAFNYGWSQTELYWFFPPIAVIGRVINHMKLCKSKGCLLVPQWKNAYFYPLLKECCLAGNVRSVTVYQGSTVLLQGSDPTSYFGPNFRGNVEVWFLDFVTIP